jgi:hypothetical protein
MSYFKVITCSCEEINENIRLIRILGENRNKCPQITTGRSSLYSNMTLQTFIWQRLNSSDVQTVPYLDIVFTFRVHLEKATVADLVTKFLVLCISNEA